MELKTYIFQININDCVFYNVFAKHQSDALTLLEEVQGGDWYDEVSDTFTITFVEQPEAEKTRVRLDDEEDRKGLDADCANTVSLWSLYQRDSSRAVVACSEW